MKVVYPWFLKVIYKIKPTSRMTWTWFLCLFFIFDITVSAMACIRQDERIHQIPATNMMDKFFDQHYPDERLNKIFPNRRNAITHEKIK